MKGFALLTAALALAGVTTAQAYQIEGQAGITRTNVDYGNGSKSSGTDVSLKGIYYINPVANAMGRAPLAEQAFLQRASNVYAAYNRAQGGDVSAIGAGGEYYMPNSQYYVAGDVERTTKKTKIQIPGGSVTTLSNDYDIYKLRVGYLPLNGLLLTAGIVGNSDNTNGELGAKYVAPLDGTNYVNLEGRVSLGDNNSYELRGDYYLDPTLGVGVSYYDSGVANSDGTFDVHAEKFLNPTFAVGAKYFNGDNTDGFGLMARMRF